MGAPRVSCPTCQRQLTWSESFPFRPFCSERCKMADLGAWFAEERKLPGDKLDELQDGQMDPLRRDG